jgi:hypothetical protein
MPYQPLKPRYGPAAFHAALLACEAAAFVGLNAAPVPQTPGQTLGCMLCVVAAVWNLLCLFGALDLIPPET